MKYERKFKEVKNKLSVNTYFKQKAQVNYPTAIDEWLEDYTKEYGQRKWNLIISLQEDQIVPFNKIVPTQPYVYKTVLDRYLSGAKRTEYTDLGVPYFIFYKGKYYLFEGHHRIVSDHLAGKPIKGVVLYMNKDYSR